MAVIDNGNSAAGKANVDAGYNLNVALPNTPAYVGSVRLMSENDTGALTGTPYLKSPETSPDYRLRVGLDTVLFYDTFNASAQNTGVWKHAFSTMTMTQSAGFLNVNAAGTSTASGNYAYLQSWKYFPLIGTAPLAVEFTGQITLTPSANEVYQSGLGIPTGAAEPVDGVWFELTSNGLFGCLRYNSGTTQKTSQLKTAASIPLNTNGKYVIVIGERKIEFWVDDVLLGELTIPVAQGQPFLTTALPLFMQKYNSGVVGSSPNMIIKVGDITVTLMDIATNKSWQQQMASTGLHAYQGQDGGTMGGTATYVNSTNPTTALPVNTALTANLPAGLGGQGLATLWNLAATDMVMCQFQNPTGGVNQTPRTLYIYGIRITAAAFTAAWTAPAAGQHLLQWGLGFGSTGVSLAQAETASFATATTKSYRRKALGLMGWATGATPIGTPADKDIVVHWDVPLVVNPGEYVSVICKMLNGAATATGGLYFTVDFDAFYE